MPIQFIPSEVVTSNGNPNWRASRGPLGPQNSNSAGPFVAAADTLFNLWLDGPSTPAEYHSFGAQQTGTEQFTFKSDWYNRFHVKPTSIDFGSFAEEVVGATRVWNAFLVPQTLSSAVAGSGAMGVTYTSPALPSVFAPLQTKDISFTAAPTGPGIITESFTLNFVSGALANVSMIGVRIDPPEGILFDEQSSGSKEDWADGMTITDEWYTSVIISRDGSEQRDALRSYPRKTVEFKSLVTPARVQAFRRRVALSGKGTFYVADQTRWIKLTAPNTNPLALQVDSLPAWAAPGCWIILRHLGKTSIRQVSTTGDSNSGTAYTLTFLTNDDMTWAIGAKVHPAFECEFADETPTNRPTNSVVTVRFRLPVIPGSQPDEDFGTPELVFDGREVMTLSINWISGIDENLLRPSELLDQIFGVQSRTFPVEQYEITQLRMTGSNNTKSNAIRNFFNRHKGRQKEFYFSSQEPELVASSPLVNGQNILLTASTEDALAYGLMQTRRAIEVKLKDGTLLHRVVETIATDEDSNSLGTTHFTLRTGWPRTIALNEIDRISWLKLGRFATDAFTMVWGTNECGDAKFSIMTLKRVEAEA